MPSYKLRRFGPLKNWYAFFSIERRSKSWSTRTSDKPLAAKRAEAYLSELFSDSSEPGDLKVVDVLLRYQDDKRGDIVNSTMGDRMIDQLVDWFGNTMVSELTSALQKSYEVERRKAGWSASTINRYRNTLRAALRHAEKEGWVRYAPFVPTTKVPTKLERWLTKQEALWLYRAVRHRRYRHLNLFIRIALATGARHEAILSLTWDHVDLENGQIDFRMPGKVATRKRRPNAPVSDRLIRLLRAAYKTREGDHVIMFRGEPVSRISNAFRTACQRAGLKAVTPHTLKHTCITWKLQAGVPIWDVAGLTATTVGTIEKVYGHHARNKLRQAANAGESAELVPNAPASMGI